MNQKAFDWCQDYPASITVCDSEGIIIAMNRASTENFSRYGGSSLIGKSLFACHSPASAEIIRQMLARQEGNTYITDNGKQKRLVQQVPWFSDGTFAGLIETIIDLPPDLQIRKRQPKKQQETT